MLSKAELESLTVRSALGGRMTRGFTMAGFLSKTELESLLAGAVRTAVINGGAAGAHAVTGIEVGDELISVLHFARDGGPPVDNIADLEDLTSEFTISDADEIDNTGGTATTDGYLVVTYSDLKP